MFIQIYKINKSIMAYFACYIFRIPKDLLKSSFQVYESLKFILLGNNKTVEVKIELTNSNLETFR